MMKSLYKHEEERLNEILVSKNQTKVVERNEKTKQINKYCIYVFAKDCMKTQRFARYVHNNNFVYLESCDEFYMNKKVFESVFNVNNGASIQNSLFFKERYDENGKSVCSCWKNHSRRGQNRLPVRPRVFAMISPAQPRVSIFFKVVRIYKIISFFFVTISLINYWNASLILSLEFILTYLVPLFSGNI